jgi:hypothetical protein
MVRIIAYSQPFAYHESGWLRGSNRVRISSALTSYNDGQDKVRSR